MGLNDGAGRLALTQVRTFPAPGWLAALGDIDGNGQPDLAYAQGADMRVLLNHLDGRRDHEDP